MTTKPQYLKRTLSILFLCLIGFCTLGLFPALKLMQFKAKEDAEYTIKKHLPEKYLVQLSDLKENKAVEWTDEDEFSLDGRLYDVVRTEQKNGHTVYYCFADSDETLIVSQINDIVKRQFAGEQSRKGLATHNLLKLLAQVYVPAKHFSLRPIAQSQLATVLNSHVKAMRNGCFIPIVTPPPRFAGLV